MRREGAIKDNPGGGMSSIQRFFRFVERIDRLLTYTYERHGTNICGSALEERFSSTCSECYIVRDRPRSDHPVPGSDRLSKTDCSGRKTRTQFETENNWEGQLF